MVGKYDTRNKLNNLTGKEWLKLTKSFWTSEKCKDDKPAMNHPAPFMVKDIMKLVSFFTKKKMVVLDPFVGSGTTLLASASLGRKSIGIDLSGKYKKLAKKRLKEKNFIEGKAYSYILGDSKEVLQKLGDVDYIVTSPPYHNILRNRGDGLRAKKDNGYRNGARTGVDYYSEHKNDLGNKETYEDFLESFKEIMAEAYKKLRSGKYCSVVISDFTVEKKEVCVQADIVNVMKEVGFGFVGTIGLLQDNKPLYPFGYPYAYKINHQHQNIINFKKPDKESQ